MGTPVEVTFPTGRMVEGSLYELNERKDKKTNQPKIGRDGLPIKQCYFALAIAKVPGQAWHATEWGQKLLQVGAAAFPNFYQHPSFAWKVIDGDSPTSSQPGAAAPNSKEGWPGHWVIKFSSGFAPSVFTRGSDGKPVEMTQKDAVNPGDYIQVAGTIAGNDSTDSPGIYVNHRMVMVQGYGARIRTTGMPDPTKAGFDAAPQLPAGASLTPIGTAMPGLPGAVPSAAALPGMPAMPGLPGAAPGAAALPVTPNAAPLAAVGAAMPGAAAPVAAALPAVAALPALAPAAPAFTVTAGAAGQGITAATIQQYLSQGHTLDSLRAGGYIV